MDGEDFEVVIKEDEYKKLKALSAQVAKIQAQSDSRAHRIGQLERELQVQQEENSFLSQAILTLGTEREKVSAIEGVEQEEMGSGQYEVLGASIMYGTNIDPKKSFIKGGQLIQKYETHLAKIKEVEERMEAQEQLITQLNNSNGQNQQAAQAQATQQLLKNLSSKQKQFKNLDELRKAIEEGRKQRQTVKKLESKQKESEDRLALVIQQIDRLNSLISNKNADHEEAKKKLLQATKQSQGYKKDLKVMTNDIKVLREEQAKTQQKLAESRKELEDIRKQAEKKQEGSEISKGDKPYRIKLLIDEHLTDMKKELCGMGDLSEREVQEMLGSELQSLVDYIQKAIKRNKN